MHEMGVLRNCSASTVGASLTGKVRGIITRARARLDINLGSRAWPLVKALLRGVPHLKLVQASVEYRLLQWHAGENPSGISIPKSVVQALPSLKHHFTTAVITRSPIAHPVGQCRAPI